MGLAHETVHRLEGSRSFGGNDARPAVPEPAVSPPGERALVSSSLNVNSATDTFTIQDTGNLSNQHYE